MRPTEKQFSLEAGSVNRKFPSGQGGGASLEARAIAEIIQATGALPE